MFLSQLLLLLSRHFLILNRTHTEYTISYYVILLIQTLHVRTLSVGRVHIISKPYSSYSSCF